MAGATKRGAFRGSTFKKASSYGKKRAAPENDSEAEDAPRGKKGKKAANDDEAEAEEAEEFVPTLQKDEDGNNYVPVRLPPLHPPTQKYTKYR
jgi:hypothetical protein